MQTTSINTAATEMSTWGVFLGSDFILQLSIVAMVLASIWSWAIIFEKIFLLRSAKEDAKKFETRFWSGGSLDEMFDILEAKPYRLDPMSSIFVAAMREWRRSSGSLTSGIHGTSLSQRIDRVMQITMDREMDRLEKRMTFLASTGSVCPFIGLFGTVWGIMHSLQGLGAMGGAVSIAAVAPGVAQALSTTALGLIAAIPAVLAFNKFSSDMDRYGKILENFAGEFSTILSRQIDDTNTRSERKETL